MLVARVVVSASIYIAAVFAVIQGVVSDPVDWVLILVAAVSFVAAYLIWPSRRRNQRDKDIWWLDFCELLVELPVEMVLWVIRLVARIMTRGGDVDVDF